MNNKSKLNPMVIKTGDTLLMTFGNGKVREVRIYSEMCIDPKNPVIHAMSCNLDGRSYPVKIEKQKPIEKESPGELR